MPRHHTCQEETVSTVCPGVSPGQVYRPLPSEGLGLCVSSQVKQGPDCVQVPPTSSKVQGRITCGTKRPGQVNHFSCDGFAII